MRAWDVAARPKQADRQQFSTALGELDGGSGIAVCFSPDAGHLLSVFTDNSFSVEDTLTLTESLRHPLPVRPFACAALAAGGELAAFVARDGNVVFWHSETGETNGFARPTTEPSNRAVFSRDGKRLAISGDRDLYVCDVPSKMTLHKIPLRGEYAFSLAFSRDGQKLMAGCASGVVKVWDLGGQADEVTLRAHTKEVQGLAVAPDGRTLISVSDEILFWDLNSHRELTRMRPRPTKFFGCSVSPDGRRLAVGAGDGLITIWDLTSLQEVATLRGHERRLIHVAFSSEGNTLVSVSPEQVRVWRAASLTEADSVSAEFNQP